MILRFVKNPYIFLNNYFKKSKSSHQTCKNKTPTSNANNFKSNNSSRISSLPNNRLSNFPTKNSLGGLISVRTHRAQAINSIPTSDPSFPGSSNYGNAERNVNIGLKLRRASGRSRSWGGKWRADLLS